MPSYYADRVRRILRLTANHDIIRSGDRILELGTGWLHWEALTLRLFFDVEAVLFDVWDNRQLHALKNYVRQLGGLLDETFGLSPEQLRRAKSLIDAVSRVKSFDELYKLLGFEYVTHPAGDLTRFRDRSFQLVVSAGMLEHVKREAVGTLIGETKRILKPGGWAVHSIDTSDHLSHYDPKVSPKRYLTFSDPTWRYLFESEIQYVNRIQRGEWLQLFQRSGFELMDEDGKQIDISGITVADRFAHMDKRDLETTLLRLAFHS
jgi:SAM-dependent methyltransferase